MGAEPEAISREILTIRIDLSRQILTCCCICVEASSVWAVLGEAILREM